MLMLLALMAVCLTVTAGEETDSVFGSPTTEAAKPSSGDSASMYKTTSYEEEKDLTLMVYLCGSSLEEENHSASADLREMMEAAFDTDRIQLLVMTGGAENWEFSFGQKEGVVISEVADSIVSVWPMEAPRKTSMGDPETLTDFLRYGLENAKARDYALILWDHGGGPLDGVCKDALHDSDSLSLPELVKGLEAARLPKKLKWIGFDACLMSSVEVFAALSPFAEYMIASLLHLELIDSQGEVSPAELVCTQDRQSGELVVLEAYLYDTAIGAYSNRQTVSLDEYEEAVYQVVDRQMPQMDVLPAFEEWEVTSTTEIRFALGQGNHFAFVKDALEEDSLQVGFKITDVFNNVYLSHMAGIHRDLSDSGLESYMVEYDDDYVTLADVSITESGRLSGRLTNCMEEEVLIGITDLFINGREAELPDSVEIGGNGIFGGLENGESQILNLRLPLQEGENVDQISFILVLYDADTLEELAQDNVTILHEGGSEAKN